METHKQTHTLVGLDEQGRTVGMRTIAHTPEGWVAGLAWAGAETGPHRWGSENSGSLGKGFAQFLLSRGG